MATMTRSEDSIVTPWKKIRLSFILKQLQYESKTEEVSHCSQTFIRCNAYFFVALLVD